MSDYRGYKVEIKTEQFGVVSGIVENYDDERIDLSDVTISGQRISDPVFSVKYTVILIRILSIFS